MSRNFYVRTLVKFTFANKIEAVHKRSLVSVKVEPRSTSPSLRSRRLEVAGERENGRARGRHARGEPVFSCAHYFQAPATQAKLLL